MLSKKGRVGTLNANLLDRTWKSDMPAENQTEPNWGITVFKQSENVIRRDVAGETVLVPLAPSGAADMEYLYRMNAVGAAVWDAMDGRATAGQLVDAVLASFDTDREDSGPVSREEIEKDVRFFLADLEKAGLVARQNA